MSEVNSSSVSIQDWNRFIREGMPEDAEITGLNVKENFDKMTKKFGKAYIEYLATAYTCKDELPDEEFCRLNGNIPLGFLNKIRRMK